MFYGKSGGNISQDVSVNTQIVRMWSDPSSLAISGWNDKISIRWIPAIGKDANGLTMYDQQSFITAPLTYAKAAALYARYQKRMKEKIENHEDPGEDGISIAVPIESKNFGRCAVMIEYKRNPKTQVPTVYLTLARNISEQGTAKDNIITYEFNKIDMMDDFQPLTGQGTLVSEEGELENFLEILRSRMTMSGMNTHATKHAAAYSKKGNSTESDGFNSSQYQTPPSLADGYMNIPDMGGDDMGLPFD